MTSQVTSKKEITNTEEEKTVEEAATRSVLDSLIGSLKTAASGVVRSAGYLLGFFSSDKQLENFESKSGKRKRSANEDDLNDENEDDLEEELELKRWRPDKVYVAVQYFLNNLLGEKDSNENIKAVSQDENKNTDASTYTVLGDTNWKKRPEIKFFTDSVSSSINDIDENGDIKKTSTPQIVVEDDAGPDVFVFSAEKKSDRKNVEDDNSLSHSTFEEKQAYFVEQIKIQESKAQDTGRRSPSPSPVSSSDQ